MRIVKLVCSSLMFISVICLSAERAGATNNCSFSTSGTTMTLQGDCTADSGIGVPNGFTLNGNGFVLTLVDPTGDHFKGAGVFNLGASANVINLTITTSNLVNVCDAGNDRLRGILFDGASGRISNNDVLNINQGASGCQEGNAIEVRNSPFDGTGTNPLAVEISMNNITSYQKTGIVANGNVFATISHNKLGASATQANLAANGIQLGFGAGGRVEFNQVAGNSWCCADASATAILLFDTAPGVLVRTNNLMEGNADVGIYIGGNGAIVDNNRVFEEGVDGFYDVGVGDYGTGNTVTNNKVRGYTLPYDNVTVGKNKVIPSPRD